MTVLKNVGAEAVSTTSVLPPGWFAPPEMVERDPEEARRCRALMRAVRDNIRRGVHMYEVPDILYRKVAEAQPAILSLLACGFLDAGMQPLADVLTAVLNDVTPYKGWVRPHGEWQKVDGRPTWVDLGWVPDEKLKTFGLRMSLAKSFAWYGPDRDGSKGLSMLSEMLRRASADVLNPETLPDAAEDLEDVAQLRGYDFAALRDGPGICRRAVDLAQFDAGAGVNIATKAVTEAKHAIYANLHREASWCLPIALAMLDKLDFESAQEYLANARDVFAFLIGENYLIERTYCIPDSSGRRIPIAAHPAQALPLVSRAADLCVRSGPYRLSDPDICNRVLDLLMRAFPHLATDDREPPAASLPGDLWDGRSPDFIWNCLLGIKPPRPPSGPLDWLFGPLRT
jgi:hypothetical protein